ncbi:MAG: hypothetical protein A2W23_09295 [Planctomycetes bacterium RBG_16_43_13]|nr:MAG: hypothetical protein A2W23_09295 [Planctomycetes bacterium RBG_16_43_13]
MIHPAQKLKILKGKFSIYIQKSKFNLQLLYDGSVVKEYKIAIGKDEETPTGKFTIETTEKNPTWYMTDKKTGKKEAIKYGDPRNILGDRWMGFNKPNSSYGIHGTTDDASIGTRASSGCIRMHNNDVIELYEIIPSGADVTIKD